MKVFVTGMTGYFGGHLMEELLRENHEITALVRTDAEADRMRTAGVKPAMGDVTSKAKMAEAMRASDAVIHLVGIIMEPRGVTFESVHVEGTRNVVEAALAAGVSRYIHMSALGVRPDAASRYHKTKYAAEEIVRRSGLTFTIFRPCVMFGPGDAFINKLKDFFNNPFFVPVIGNGRSKLQPVFVKDVARMFALSLKTPAAENKIVEISGTKPYSYEELTQAIGKHLGKKRFIIHAPMFLMEMVASFSQRFMAVPIVTKDQLLMLQEDNVCDPAPAADLFGIKLTSLEDGMKLYL